MHRRTLTALLPLAAALALGPAALPASDWPRFRGPNGTGVADPADAGLPVKCDGGSVRWKVPIPGLGNSSPIVSKGRVFLETASDDGQARLLLCLDAKTGQTVWTQATPGGPPDNIHKKFNTLASSTPAADGERVYALFWDGRKEALAAFDYDGHPAWQRDLGPFSSQHGVGTSPMVWNGKVYLNNDMDGRAVLQAFDARTGAPLWEVKREPFRASYPTPFLLEEGGKPQLIVASTAGVTSYDPETGAQNWTAKLHFESAPLRMVGCPVAGPGMVFATFGEGAGTCLAVGIKTGGTGDVTATHTAWEKRKSFPYVPAMLVKDGYLYFVNDRGRAACHDTKTGAEVWSQTLGGGFMASPVLVGDRVYALNDTGTLFVFAASPKGYQELGKSIIGEGVMATPAVADGRLFVRGRSHLICIGGTDGK
jgi:outer membrane protein assembly factor BamB